MIQKTKLIEPILFGYMFCFFASLPMEEQLIYKKLCLQKFNSSYCEVLRSSKNETHVSNQNIIQKETAAWQIYVNIAKTLPSLGATIACGLWSDHVGRKRFMILPLVGDFCLCITLLLNSYLILAPISFMLIGTFISGIFGNVAAILSATFSYLADVTSVSFRTKRAMILESMIPISSVFSNLIAGFLLQKYGFVAVFTFLLSVYGVVIIYWYFLEESYCGTIISLKPFKEICSLKSVFSIFNVLTVKRLDRFRMTIWMLIGCFFCLICFVVGSNAVAVLYVLHSPLNFTPSMIGYFLAELNSLRFIGACLVTYFLLHRLKCHDNYAILICFLAIVGFSFSIVFATKPVHVFASSLWGIGLGVGLGAIRGRLSKLVSPAEQGKMFSALACLEVLIILFSSVMFNAIYKATVSISPGMTFYVLGSFSVMTCFLVLSLIFYGEQGSYYVPLTTSSIYSSDAECKI